MANEATPYFDPSDTVTGYCSAAVTGKRFVAVSGVRTADLVSVAHATPATTPKAVGVASRDAALGSKVMIACEGVWPVTAGEALTAGDRVSADATGKAVKLATAVAINAAAVALGTVWDDVANGADAPVKLNV